MDKALKRLINEPNIIYLGGRMSGKTELCRKAFEQRQKDIEIVKKSLKALEIIKKHRLDIDWFLQFVKQDISYKHYVYCIEQSDNKFAQRFKLSQEEYELLKEVLKWKN